jgi:hypothetical protein
MLGQLFLYIPGIVIFLIGSNAIRIQHRIKRLGACTESSVVSCTHVVKKDKQERTVMNYYNVVVEYPEGGRQTRKTVRSPNEYSVGQQVKLFRNDRGEYTLLQEENQSCFGPWPTAIGGALLILMALMQNKDNELGAMACLAIVLAGAGAILIHTYTTLKKRDLEPLDGEIIDVFKRQISKETKILRDSKFTYYPIVSYLLDGKKNIRRCSINSSREQDFKVGDRLTLYFDRSKGQVLEQHAKLSFLIWGVALLAVGLLAGVSMISVFVSPL